MFLESKHIEYIMKMSKDHSSFEYEISQHFRMSGIYWGLTAMSILGRDLAEEMDTAEIVKWVFQCQDEVSGGFGGSVGHDAHLLYTLSALQILALTKQMHQLEDGVDKIAVFIGSLQNEDGSFSGDCWGEVDTRFSYCALSSLALIVINRYCTCSALYPSKQCL